MIKLQFLFGILLGWSATCSAAPATSKQIDYVIVGGGPAGYVVAEKLSQNPKVNVLLLEAGFDASTDPMITTPAKFFYTQDFMWHYDSQPVATLDGQTPNLWQGRLLGGGSGCNAMLYCRGSSSVFDEWAEISGNSGLAWKSLREDFKQTTHYRSEPRADYPQLVNEDAFGNGPIEVSRATELVSFGEKFATILKSTLGLKSSDLVSGTGIGVTEGLESIRVSNRTRSYAVNGYGYLMANRPNVQVLEGAWVQHIGFKQKTAESVTFTRGSETHTIRAREIVVAAGALKSPQLLMLSGVGPKAKLKQLGIPIVADIPEVGAKLYDHTYAVMQFKAADSVETVWQWAANSTGAAIANEQYTNNNGAGLLGGINGDVYGALRVPDSVFKSVNSHHYLRMPKDRAQLIYSYATTPFLQPSPNVSIIAGYVVLLQPEASGYVTLNTSDYRDAPLVHSKFWSTPGDKAAIMYGYKQLRKIMHSRSLSPLLHEELYPGEGATIDEDIWRAIKQSSQSWHHALGTVALGTVLDRNWRVKGLKGIRVVGSPAIPRPPTCAIQAHVYAVAHRAALDIIEADGLDGCRGRGNCD